MADPKKNSPEYWEQKRQRHRAIAKLLCDLSGDDRRQAERDYGVMLAKHHPPKSNV